MTRTGTPGRPYTWPEAIGVTLKALSARAPKLPKNATERSLIGPNLHRDIAVTEIGVSRRFIEQKGRQLALCVSMDL